ncbi:MAG: cation diffusion facilitator family transporter [Planctomycetota bacterium]
MASSSPDRLGWRALSNANPARRAYRAATRATLLGLFINLALGAVKLVGGILAASFALMADAVNSLGDAVTSLVVLYALRVAQKPPDKEHPYGHARAEAVAGSSVALVIILSALVVGYEAIRRFGTQHGAPPAWALWIAAANVVIKEGLYRYKASVGRRTGSSALLAHAWDHRSDALCSAAVLIGLAIVLWGGPAFVWADEVAALIVVLAILGSGAHLFRRSAHELLDAQAEDALLDRIRESARSVPGVEEVEKLWVRKAGLEYLADIHVEVQPRISVEEGHRIAHEVKDRLMGSFETLRHVLVHIEPHGVLPPAP